MVQTSIQTTQYLRVATMAMGAYDYLITIPAEYRIYKTQFRLGRITLSCCLFILIRYISIICFVSGAITWFGIFTLHDCHRYLVFPRIFNGLQVTVSQLILGIRTYNLSQRSRAIGLLILMFYIATLMPQWVSAFRGTKAVIYSDGTQCHRAVNPEALFGPWIFYLVAIIYDFLVTAISFAYLVRYYFSATTFVISNITKVMIYDGIGYFVLITATNIFNIILFKTSPQAPAGISLSFSATWIMSQRILIDLHEASIKHQNGDKSFAFTNKSTPPVRRVSCAIQTQLGSKDWTKPSPDADQMNSTERGEQQRLERDVHVRIQQPMTFRDHPWLAEMGLCMSRITGAELVSCNSWATATHDTRDEEIRAARDPMMVTIR